MFAKFKPTIVLTSICIIVALLLGCVNIITAPAIAKQEERKAKAALYSAYNSGNDVEFTKLAAEELVEYSIPAEIKEVHSASAGGYVFIGVTGSYGGDIKIAVGVNADGEITGVKVVSNTDTANKIQSVLNAIEGNKGKYNGQNKDNLSPVIIAGSTVSSEACALIVDAALRAFSSLKGEDARTDDEVFADNLNIVLDVEGKKFTKWFATAIITGIDAIYTTSATADGIVMVIGDKLIGVKADGSITDTVSKLDKKAEKVATTAEDIAAVEAAYTIFQTAATTEIALPDGAKATVKKAYVTAGGTYVFEMETTGSYADEGEYSHGSGKIQFTVSIGADGKIIDIITTKHGESKNYGANCATEAFYESFRGATREQILDLDISDIIPNEDNGYETDNLPSSIQGPGIIANATFTTVYYHNAVLDAFDAFLKLTEKI
nr:FMN-binding protein [Clostridia bacterium]